MVIAFPQGIILVYDIIAFPQGIILVYDIIAFPQGIILVYDITNQKSFDNITKWLQNIEMVSGCRHDNSCLCPYMVEVLYNAYPDPIPFHTMLPFHSWIPIPPVPIPFQHASADVERLLIGNKCDWETRRIVPKERGEELAASQGIPFLETSAKTNTNIDEVSCYRYILVTLPRCYTYELKVESCFIVLKHSSLPLSLFSLSHTHPSGV